jgi:hypothetical protein
MENNFLTEEKLLTRRNGLREANLLNGRKTV